MKLIKNFLLVLLFAIPFNLSSQITAYQYSSDSFNEKTINDILEQSKKKGTKDWEINLLKEHLYKRLHQQNIAKSTPPQPQASCTNIDFENGTYSGWSLTSGNINGVTLPCNTCASNPGGIAAITTAVNSGGSWTAGIDNCTGISALAPGGGVYSLCINDITAGGKMQEIQQTFLVSATNNIFTYQYLAVLQDGGHAATDQPYFMSQVLDGSGAVIPCTYVLQSASAAITGWTPALNCPGTNYKGWVTVTLDLTAYLAQNVTIQFLVSDCNQGGHYGYCYIDASCNQINRNTTVNICPPSTQLCGPPGFLTYNWTGPVTGNAMCLNGAVAGNYTLVTTGQCPAPTRFYTVTVNQPPTSSFSATTVCVGSPTSFTDQSITNGGGAINSWNWLFGDGGTSNVQNPTHTYATSGTYTASLAITNINGCPDTFTTVVNVNPGIIPSFSAPTVCLGSPTIFNNTTVGALTYSWTFGDGGISNVQNPTHTYATTGSFVVTLSVSAGGCVGVITNTAVVNPIPVLNSTSNISVCDQQQVNIPPFVSNPIGSTTTWTNTNITIGLGANGNGNIPPFIGLSNGSTTPVISSVSVTPTLNGCIGPVSVFSITISPQPTITIASPAPYCPGDVVPSPNIISNPIGSTYTWTNSNNQVGLGINGVGIPTQFTANPNPNFTNSNVTGVITVTPSLGSCIGLPTTYTVIVKPTPIVNPVNSVEYCPSILSNSINFTSSPLGGSFFWTNTNIGIGLAASNNGNLPSFNTINATQGVQSGAVFVHATLNGCPGPDITFTISINPNPIALFKSNSKVCDGTKTSFIDLSTVGSGSITQWSWDMNNDGVFGDDINQNPQYLITPSGSHTVSLMVTTNKGCTNKVSEVLFVNPNPIADFKGDTLMGCTIHNVDFDDLSSVGNPSNIISWNWNFGNGTTSNLQTPGTVHYSNISHTAIKQYTVTLNVVSDSGCVNSITKLNYITVYPKPLADFNWSPQNPAPDINDPTIYFIDLSQGSSGVNGLTWNFGDILTNSNTSNVNNPVHVYASEIANTYYVTQNVQNIYGCKDVITKPVEILQDFVFYIPNAFTPNGDGLNDGFKGTGIGIDNSTYNIWIFDRWGNMIFSSNDIDKSWDGRVNGKGDIVQEDVYVWKVKFSDFSGKKHEYKGIVSVIK